MKKRLINILIYKKYIFYFGTLQIIIFNLYEKFFEI